MKSLISWVDIPATDFQRAVKFYKNVLGIELQEFDCGTEKMACFPSGEGAISYSPGHKPSKDGVLVSLNTGDDFDNAMLRIEKNGGKIIKPKTKIEVENRGYFSIFIDSEGNRMSLYGDK